MTRSSDNHAVWRIIAERRRGATAVEFALMLPVMVVLLTGVVELNWQSTAVNTLNASVGLAARLSTMNTSAELAQGTTLNDKVVEDVRHYLTSNGLTGNQATVTILSEEQSDIGQPFDLTDPDNEHRRFRITVQIPVANLRLFPDLAGRTTYTASVVYQKPGGEVLL